MAYDLKGVVAVVEDELKKAPRTSLQGLSNQLRIERHTIEKAVRNQTGKSFRKLRDDIAFEIARSHLRSQPLRSIKEVPYQLGYHSPRAFARFIRRSSGEAPNKFRRGV